MASRTDPVVEAAVKPPVTPIRFTKPRYSVDEVVKMRKLFLEKRFDQLDKISDALQSAFEQNSSLEYKIQDFFILFRFNKSGYQELLDAWVAHSPSRFTPYLARAEYYAEMSFVKRGGQWAANTSEKQIQGMREYQEKEAKDIDSALAINPRLLNAYRMRIDMYSTEGRNREKIAATFRQGKTLFPTSFLLYETMIDNAAPRWGGSYVGMNSVALDAYQKVEKNPDLYVLFGEIYADQGELSLFDKQYSRTVSLYSKALNYGETSDFLENRAWAYFDVSDYDNAFRDADRSIAIRPSSAMAYLLRAEALISKGDLAGGTKDIRFAQRNLDVNEDGQKMVDWCRDTIIAEANEPFKKDPTKAIGIYNMALEVDPHATHAHHWRGMAYLRLGKKKEGRADVEQAILDDPQNIEAYETMDNDILMREKKWDDILSLWGRFLALEPNNPVAYMERSGTYYHKGNMKMAQQDMHHACELGKQEACQIEKERFH